MISRSLIALTLTAAIAGVAYAQSQFGQSPGARMAIKPNQTGLPNLRRAFPRQYVYRNTTLGVYPNAYPYGQIEFFVAPWGVARSPQGANPPLVGRNPRGLTPGDAFATPQQCYDHVAQTYFYDGTFPICRIVAGTYIGPIQISGPIGGTQIDGGSSIGFWGTCTLAGSPWNDSVGRVAGAADVILQSDTNGTMFSVINQGEAKGNCVTVKADGYGIAVQQHSTFFIDGSMRFIAGPTKNPTAVIRSENMGQVYVAAMEVATSGGSVASSANLSQISFIGAAGTVTFTGSPTFTQTLDRKSVV